MKLFSRLYSRVMTWSRHPKAQYYLGALSFAESSFFPIPPDVMLMPMALAKPNKAIFYATITTLASVLGGIFGYFLGYMAFQSFVHPLLIDFGHEAQYLQIREWFDVWGLWVIFIAGFSPIPYKLFTVTAGALSMPLMPFILASYVARGARFYLVALLMRYGGKKLEDKLFDIIDKLGWAVIILAVGGYGLHYFLS